MTEALDFLRDAGMSCEPVLEKTLTVVSIVIAVII